MTGKKWLLRYRVFFFRIFRFYEPPSGADLYSLGVVTWLIFTGGMHNTAPPVSQRPEFSAHFHDWAQLHHCVQINFPPFRGQNVSAAIGPIG